VTLVVVGIGGAVGAVCRYAVSGWIQDLAGGFFPWGTLVVNVMGSLLLGFALAWLQTTMSSSELREFVTIGLLGSFTTFSTFSFEALAMLRDGEWWRAGGYTVGSVALALLAVGLGWALAVTLTPHPGA
jgi:CrcB protein